VEVTPHMQVVGQDRVYAVGDLTTGAAKMAAIASRQAGVAAANILATIDGAELQSFTPAGPAIAVPIGPNGGAGQFPGQDEIAGRETIAERKGREMGIERLWERFRLAAPEAA